MRMTLLPPSILPSITMLPVLDTSLTLDPPSIFPFTWMSPSSVLLMVTPPSILSRSTPVRAQGYLEYSEGQSPWHGFLIGQPMQNPINSASRSLGMNRRDKKTRFSTTCSFGLSRIEHRICDEFGLFLTMGCHTKSTAWHAPRRSCFRAVPWLRLASQRAGIERQCAA